MLQPTHPARIALKIINVILGLLAGGYTLLVMLVNIDPGLNLARLASLIAELGVFVGFVWLLVKSIKVFDQGYIGLAYFLSIGSFFFASALSFGACLATVKL